MSEDAEIFIGDGAYSRAKAGEGISVAYPGGRFSDGARMTVFFFFFFVETPGPELLFCSRRVLLIRNTLCSPVEGL